MSIGGNGTGRVDGRALLDRSAITSHSKHIPSAGQPDHAIGVEKLGPINAIHLAGEGQHFHRSNGQTVPSRKPSFTFCLQMSGVGQFQQFGRLAQLEQGDVTLCDDSAPFTYLSESRFELLMLQIPRDMLQEELPRPRDWCGRRLACEHDLVATAGAMAISLMGQLRHGLSDECRGRAAKHLLGLITTCYAAAFADAGPRAPVMADRLWHVRMFIEQNLRDPELSPAKIATSLKLSSRYLRMIFARGNESLSAYILRRRLEECALCLRDRRWTDNSITEIAFSWGFNSAPHFTRSFRERFNVSPRDYRQNKAPVAPATAPAFQRPAPATAVAA